MKLKKISALLLCLVLVIGLVACNNTTTPPESESPTGSESETTDPAPATDKVKLTYAFWGGEDEAKSTEAALNVFNESQENITVESVPIPWETYMDKLNTMAIAGELPDTAIMNEAGVIQWAEQGLLHDIGQMYGENDAKPLDATAFTYKGKTVAYSTAFETLLMFYNKDMFDAAGLEYPAADSEKAWTWDEFLDNAKKLTLDASGKNAYDPSFDKNNIVQYGCMIENLTWQLEVWCLSNGSGFYNDDGSKVIINDPAAIEALQRIADLHLVENVAPLSSGLTDDGVQRSLIAGTCAMTTNGAWNIGTALSEARKEGLNYGIGVLPYMKDKVTINTGGPNVVFSQTKQPTEAMEWLKWYSREENNWDGLIATGIWMPILDSYYTDEALTHKWLDNPAYPPYEESKAVLVDYAMTYSRPTAWFYTNNTIDFNTLLGSVLGDVWTGKITVQQAITDNFTALENAHRGDA